MGKFINYFNIYTVYQDDQGFEKPIVHNNSQQDYDCFKLKVPYYCWVKLVDNGLGDWKVEVVDWLDTNVAGHCDYQNKVIRIALLSIRQLNWEQLKDLIFHEIAHALTPNHHHDEVWKAKAIELGCKGSEKGSIVLQNINDGMAYKGIYYD
jgi:hypothetical protein